MEEEWNKTEQAAGEPSRVIQNVALLDLTGMKSPDDLAGIRGIRDVAIILVPESLQARLASIPIEDVAAIVPVPEGGNVKVQTGQVKLSGEALANTGGGPDDVLILSGQTTITTPVHAVGYKQLIVVGQMFAPKGSESALGSGVTRLTGQIFYFSEQARLINGEERFSREFFELLDAPISIFLNGSLRIEPGVTADLLKAKVSEIALNGEIVAPKALIPMLQILTIEKNGVIRALEDETKVQAPEDELRASEGDG